MPGLEVTFDRLTDDDRRYLFPPREQFFDHLNPLLIARHISVETHYFLQFGKMTPQPSDIVAGLAHIEPLQAFPRGLVHSLRPKPPAQDFELLM